MIFPAAMVRQGTIATCFKLRFQAAQAERANTPRRSLSGSTSSQSGSASLTAGSNLNNSTQAPSATASASSGLGGSSTWPCPVNEREAQPLSMSLSASGTPKPLGQPDGETGSPVTQTCSGECHVVLLCTSLSKVTVSASTVYCVVGHFHWQISAVCQCKWNHHDN